MYSNPLYYLLLLVAAVIFLVYIFAVFKNDTEVKFDFFEFTNVDNNAYWEYNNKLYHAKIVDGKIDGKSAIIVNSYGMKAKEAYEMMKGVSR